MFICVDSVENKEKLIKRGYEYLCKLNRPGFKYVFVCPEGYDQNMLDIEHMLTTKLSF